LFSWNSLSDPSAEEKKAFAMGLFQSLFSWNSLSDVYLDVEVGASTVVSILVLVELALGQY